MLWEVSNKISISAIFLVDLVVATWSAISAEEIKYHTDFPTKNTEFTETLCFKIFLEENFNLFHCFSYL